MYFGVSCSGVTAAILENNCQDAFVSLCSSIKVTLGETGFLLLGPPGCSSRKLVTSHTCLSTTIQQSCAVRCSETWLVEIRFLCAITKIFAFVTYPEEKK